MQDLPGLTWIKADVSRSRHRSY